MPPIRQDNVGEISNEELSDRLKEFGVQVGPINMATRRTYERRLLKLVTGQASPPSRHAPVPDDEDDDEVVLKKPAQRMAYAEPTPEPIQPRHRQPVQESHIPTPKGDSLSRPGLGRKAMPSTSTPIPFSASQQRSGGPAVVDSSAEQGGIPAWVKLTVLLVVVVLVFLIYSNMESGAVSSIPTISNKVEV